VTSNSWSAVPESLPISATLPCFHTKIGVVRWVASAIHDAAVAQDEIERGIAAVARRGTRRPAEPKERKRSARKAVSGARPKSLHSLEVSLSSR
jgi:NADPH-dependent glutamate synthase beta subunit-like oxidoreductase